MRVFPVRFPRSKANGDPLLLHGLLPWRRGPSAQPNAGEASCGLSRGELRFHQRLIGLRPNAAVGENNLQWHEQYGELVSTAGGVCVCAQLPPLPQCLSGKKISVREIFSLSTTASESYGQFNAFCQWCSTQLMWHEIKWHEHISFSVMHSWQMLINLSFHFPYCTFTQ